MYEWSREGAVSVHQQLLNEDLGCTHQQAILLIPNYDLRINDTVDGFETTSFHQK